MFKIDKSKIHGKGVIATQSIQKGQSLGEGISFIFLFFPFVTEHLGQWINHSYTPNAILEWNEKNFTWDVVTIHDIKANDEITLNYIATPWYIQGPENHFL